MRASVSDLRLQSQAVHFLRANPARRCSEVATELGISQQTCDRLLKVLAMSGRVTCSVFDFAGYGRPSKLWSASPLMFHVTHMTAEEMAAEIAAIVALQPWPAWMILPSMNDLSAAGAE